MSQITITLPDGTKKQFDKGVSGTAIAESIGEGLAKAALAIKVNGQLRDMYLPVNEDANVAILTWRDDEGKAVFWHSTAHILAHAVTDLFPDAHRVTGPALDQGFYHDFDRETPFSEEDLVKIEKRMQELIKENFEVTREELSTHDAKKYFEKNPYKLELLEEFDDPVSIYYEKEKVDLCRGPHVPKTGMIKAFKLLKVSGAYWKGDAKNKQLQRIYGVSFPDKKELKQYLHNLEEAKKRDHRLLGKKLDLFVFSDLVGSGLPLFTPRGTILREELNAFSQKLRTDKGFQKVWIPHMTKNDLYKVSGHWAKFGEELFLVKSQETSDELVLKPMNCPHHQQIFASQTRSYRDLPLRYLETTTIYRDEKAGELAGLSRVRSITQDDSHVFCRPDQIEAEYQILIDIVKKFFETVNMPLKARISVRDPKTPEAYLGHDELWDKAENILLDIAKKNKLDYYVGVGEAAFYGPKIDFMAKDALGREWQLATPQLDFVQPQRFGLKYADADGTEKTPVMIHFALMGSIERFLSAYIEHIAGKFPLWLAPEQIRIMTVSDASKDFAEQVASQLQEQGIRVEIDGRAESIPKKVREAQLAYIPLMVTIGEKEKESNTLAVRTLDGKTKFGVKVDEFSSLVTTHIEKKSSTISLE